VLARYLTTSTALSAVWRAGTFKYMLRHPRRAFGQQPRTNPPRSAEVRTVGHSPKAAPGTDRPQYAAPDHAPRPRDEQAGPRPCPARPRPTSPITRQIEITLGRLGRSWRLLRPAPRMSDRLRHPTPPSVHRQLPRRLERLPRTRKRHRLPRLLRRILRPLPRLRPRMRSQVEGRPVDRQHHTGRSASLQVKVCLYPLRGRHVNVWPGPRHRRIVRVVLGQYDALSGFAAWTASRVSSWGETHVGAHPSSISPTPAYCGLIFRQVTSWAASLVNSGLRRSRLTSGWSTGWRTATEPYRAFRRNPQRIS
jgi:hypothetical protein